MEADHLHLVYSPITSDELRLLTILQVSPCLELRLTTCKFSADTPLEYEALSYAWDTTGGTEDCICNGVPLPGGVSRSLAQALRSIYMHHGRGSPAPHLWVDALCINQADASEKAVQVAGMGQGLRAVMKITRNWKRLSPDEIRTRGCLPPDDPCWRDLMSVFSRSWFQRLWIVQEVVLASQCVLLCGTRSIGWDAVMDFVDATDSLGYFVSIRGIQSAGSDWSVLSSVATSIRFIRNLGLLKDVLRAQDAAQVADGVEAIQRIQLSQRATLKSDYIYAIHSMLPKDLRAKVPVDYSDEVEQNFGMLHARFFRLCLEHASDWPSWCFPPINSRSADIQVPSWCPIWGYGWTMGCLPLKTPITRRAGRPSTDSRLLSFYPDLHVASDDTDKILSIAAIRVDTVHEVIALGSVLDSTTDALDLARFLALIKTLESYSSRLLDATNFHQRLLDVLCGVIGWYGKWRLAERPDGNPPISLVEFAKHLAANRVQVSPYYTADPLLSHHQLWSDFLNIVTCRWPGRSFALTTSGRMALVPSDTEPGDVVCVFLGATYPQILSRHEDGLHWAYVGPAVVDGIMQGEIFDTRDDWMERKEIFHLR